MQRFLLPLFPSSFLGAVKTKERKEERSDSEEVRSECVCAFSFVRFLFYFGGSLPLWAAADDDDDSCLLFSLLFFLAPPPLPGLGLANTDIRPPPPRLTKATAFS